MAERVVRRRRRGRRRRRRLDEAPSVPAPATGVAGDRLSAFYATGARVRLGDGPRAKPDGGRIAGPEPRGDAAAARNARGILPEVHGRGVPRQVVAYCKAKSIQLEGKTTADYSGSTFSVKNAKVREATGCTKACAEGCVRVTGKIVVVFKVKTKVSLPKVSDYPCLTPCQKKRVKNAIDKKLKPHERKHVKAFKTYNGTRKIPFDLKICKEDLDSEMQALFDAEDIPRQAAANAKSDLLDPFHVDIDLDCEDKKKKVSQQQGEDEGASQAVADVRMPEGPEPEPHAPEDRESQLVADTPVPEGSEPTREGAAEEPAAETPETEEAPAHEEGREV